MTAPRERTERHGLRPGRLLAGAFAALLLLGAAACTSDDPPPEKPDQSRSDAAKGSSTPSSPSSSSSASQPSGSSTVSVYYVGDTKSGVRLFREFHKVPFGKDGKLQAALDLAVRDSADDPDYRTGLPSGTEVKSAKDGGQVVRIDLAGPDLTKRPPETTRTEARQALNALVFTAGGVLQRNVAVSFTLGGKAAPTVLGIRVGKQLRRAPADKVKSTVSVFDPTEGASVKSPFKVNGEAATFEANVVWELKRGTKVVRKGFTTAQECCTLSPYSFTVKAPPGRYTLVVHDTDESDGEGVGTGQDTKRITVR